MELQEYCHNVETELIVWETKLHDIVRKIDKLGTAERGRMLPNVDDLRILMEDMKARIHQLRTECPTEWNPVKKELDEAHINMRDKYEETVKAIGKAAPFSVPG